MNNPQGCTTVKTTIPRGAIIATIARSLFVISVPIVDNKTEIGRTNTIIAIAKITNCHDKTSINTDDVNDEVIKIKTVDTRIDDAFSMK